MNGISTQRQHTQYTIQYYIKQTVCSIRYDTGDNARIRFG